MDIETLAAPTVHLNGTSKGELSGQLEEAAHAVWAAINAVAHASPNGRDYYPQGNAALRLALLQHGSRLARLRSVYQELQNIREAIEGVS